MSDVTDASAHEFLTVRELAELLRIKERKVYDLAASGEVPCARVTGKLLFPEAAIREWIAGASSRRADAPRPPIFLGSSDPLLEWAIRQSSCGLATLFDGSLDGLERFAARQGVAAGLHVPDADLEDWNTPAVATADISGCVLVGWALRRRGLVIRVEDTDRITSIRDLRGRRVASRQSQSGTHLLFERLLSREGVGIDEMRFGQTARSEHDAVSTVASGLADAAFGLESLARLHQLEFVPLVEERFDLLVDRRAWFEPEMQRLFRFCRTEEFLNRAGSTPGYDTTECLAVRWNARG